MLPYVVIFAAVLYFALRGLGWLDEWADRRSGEPRKPSQSTRRLQSQEEARRLEVYKQFLEGDSDSPDEET